MKIYFSASISSGRENKHLYLELINHLKNYGEVLTEHIGDPNLTEEGEQGKSDQEIYERDMRWLKEADVLVAEVSIPSLGIGYEISKAEHQKRMLCLYHPQQGKRLSSMISGNKNFIVKNYKTKEEAIRHIDDFFKT